MLVALALFTLSVVMVVLIVRRVTRPLAELIDATDKIGRGELDASIPCGALKTFAAQPGRLTACVTG
ncbi:HAMP domain-containing protein [Aliamphritea spongicola]|nr:HAMP domain-containing protein [Aliamphritea spongicola]